MPSFKEREKARYEATRSALLFPRSGMKWGDYKQKPRPFCLPLEHADENLFDDVRSLALTHFRKYGIKWHDGKDKKPSNHLCDSQVCCANFLFPFAEEPTFLGDLLGPIFPELTRMESLTEEGMRVDFEVIGEKNYLGERTGKNGRRTRGANCTSADAAVVFSLADGTRHLVLIEWKYTEAYGVRNLSWSYGRTADGRVPKTDRREIYRPLLEAPDAPIDLTRLSSIDDLFYEPFYQFMRQQLLAEEMRKAGESG